jgi:hypothetical protein
MSKEDSHIGYKTEEIMLEIQNDVEAKYVLTNSWIDALSEYCIQYDVEETQIVQYLSPVLIKNIKQEAKSLNLIKRDNFDIEIPF